MGKGKTRGDYTELAKSDALQVLTPLQKEVVRMRLGLLGDFPTGKQYSVKEIAKHFSVSTSKIYRILNKSQRKALYFATRVGKAHRTAEELKQVAEALEAIKQKKATPEEVSAIIKAQLPELASFIDTLPQTRSELYAFITILLTVISLLVSLASSSKSKDASSVTINQPVTNIITTPESMKDTKAQKAVKRSRKKKRPNANNGV